MPTKLTKLKIVLLENRISQRKVAKSTEINEGTVSLISNGRLIPTLTQKAKISEAIGKREAELFGAD